MELVVAVTAVIFSLIALNNGPLAGYFEFLKPEEVGSNYWHVGLSIWITGVIMIAASGGGLAVGLYVSGFSLFILCAVTLARLLYLIHNAKVPLPAPTNIYVVITALCILALACFNFANHWVS